MVSGKGKPSTARSLFLLYIAYCTPVNEVWGGGVYRNHPVCMSVRLSVQSKLNLGYNFWTKRDGAFILHIWVLCDKTFLSIPKNFTFWPWPRCLTYFWKNLTLALTFEPKEIGLSYEVSGILVTIPFCLYQKNWHCDLELDFWPLFEKT